MTTDRTTTTDHHAEPQLVYGSVDEFLREYLRLAYRREVDGYRTVWRARWWTFPEAVGRLDALWRAWEHLHRNGGIGPSTWWRNHTDHHLPILLSRDGPFGGDGAGDPDNLSDKGTPLPYARPPQACSPTNAHQTPERLELDALVQV